MSPHALIATLFLLALAAGRAPLAQETRGLSSRVGERAFVLGKLSPNPWQHLIRGDRGGDALYVDLPGGGQIVAYLEGGMECRGPVLLRGEVLLTEGRSKRPGSEERYAEVQIAASRGWCLTGSDAAGTVLGCLGDEGLSGGEREDLEAILTDMGKDAIPALIAHAGDPRVLYRERVLLNEGELMNRAPNAPPVREQWGETPVTLGERCEAVLLRIVTPRDYDSPYAKNAKPFSAGAHPFRVADWNAWWSRNRERSLEAIRASFEPVIDAYWRSHGTQQVVK